MNWDALGASAELLGAIAVIISVVYLAFQIRQNTKQIEENTRATQAAAFDSSITHGFSARQAIAENGDLARIFVEGSQDPTALSEIDKVRYRLVVQNILWSVWNMQTQTKFGSLQEELWDTQTMTLKRVLTTPGARWIWEHYSQEYGREFQSVVNQLLAENERSDCS